MENRINMKNVFVPNRTQKKKLLPKNTDEYDTELSTLSEFIIA